MMENAMIAEFSQLMNTCEGQVIFVTAEGDRLVADSMLSALVGFSALLSVASQLPLQIECESAADCARIQKYMKKHRLGQYRPA
jgi:hypothetical protein